MQKSMEDRSQRPFEYVDIYSDLFLRGEVQVCLIML